MDAFRRPRPLLGIAFRVAASLLVVGYSALVKLVAESYPVGQLFFARAFFGFIPVLLWAAWAGHLATMVRTERYGAHLGRASVTAFAIVCSFLALAYLPLADATAIAQSSPLIFVVFAALFLGERVGAYRWSAVAVGFCGVFLIVSNYVGFEGGGAAQASAMGPVFGFLSAVAYAFSGILVSTLTRYEHVTTITFHFSLFGMIGALLTLPFGWQMPGLADLLIFIGIGVAAGMAQIFLTQSLRFADASLVAPFDYLMLVWAIIVGFALFGHLPTASVVIGAAIVGAAGLVVIWRERRPRA